MPRKNANKGLSSSEDAKSCWECVRRTLDCDGGRPICQKCIERGLECPGYDNKKPLVWVTPGKTTHRAPQRPSRRKAAAAKGTSDSTAPINTTPTNTTPTGTAPSPSISEDDATNTALVPATRFNAAKHVETPTSSGCTDIVLASRADTGQGVKRNVRPSNAAWNQYSTLTQDNIRQYIDAVPASLWVEDYEFINAAEYYLNAVHLPYVPNQIIQSIYRPDNLTVAKLVSTYSDPFYRHSFIAMTVIHYLFAISKHTDFSPPAHARTRLYHHKGTAIRTLNAELSNYKDVLNFESLAYIWSITGVESIGGVYLAVRAHLDGFLSLIDLHGGFQKVLASPTCNRAILQAFIVSCVVSNTTSPPSDQIGKVSELSMNDLHTVYTYSALPDFPCPPHLYLDMVRINKLRVEAAKNPSIMHPGEPGSESARDILNDIWSFVPEDWVQSRDVKRPEECLLVARIFQHSVALYAILSLQHHCGSRFPSDIRGLDNMPSREESHRRLFDLVELAMDRKCDETMGWPLIVAGVAAKTRLERTTVIENINKLIDYLGAITPIRPIKKTLNKFWASGKKGWDDCFDRAHLLV